jgi:hypothetical protein
MEEKNSFQEKEPAKPETIPDQRNGSLVEQLHASKVNEQKRLGETSLWTAIAHAVRKMLKG